MTQTKNVKTEVELEPKAEKAKEALPKIAVSIVVLDNGSIIVQKNEKPIVNVQKVEFYADGQSAPRLTITEAIVPKK